MKPSSIVVSRRGFFSRPLLIALICSVILLAAVAGYQMGLQRAGYNTLEAARNLAIAEERIEVLLQENKTLSERSTRLETAAMVDSEAYRQVERQLVDLQDRILEQQEDIEFYRGIVNEDDGSMLRIQDFTIQPGLSSGEFELRLVLAQALRSSREVSGRVEVAFDGIRDGRSVRLSLAETSAESVQMLNYSFRYFEDLKASIVLPDGFQPERVRVLVRPRGNSAKTVEEFFVWKVDSG